MSGFDLDEETIFIVSHTFKALGEESRIRILSLLLDGERSVSSIAETLDMKQSNVSHQLRFLKNLRLVKSRRDGQSVYYSHDDTHVIKILREMIEHARHN